MKNFDIKWVSTILFILAGTSVALKMPWIQYCFPCFAAAHAIIYYDQLKTEKNKPLMIQNGYFLIVNIIATFIWFKE
jgi:hypothetical protein